MGPRRISERLARRIKRFEHAVALEVDALVFVSDFLAQELFAELPAARSKKWMVAPNFLPDDWATRAAGSTSTVSNEADDGPLRDLVNVGRLSKEKNQRFVLDVVAAARERGRRLTLTIVGSGSDEAALRAHCRALELDDQVEFAGASDDVAAVLRSHRVYVHGSRHETFGIVLIEAMSVGLPVFAAPVEGVKEVFRDQIEGRYIDLESPGDSAEILLAALDDPEWMRVTSAAAADRVASAFRASVVGPELVAFLRSLWSAPGVAIGPDGS